MRGSIRARLITSFTIAILIPSLITVAVGVTMIRDQVYTKAQAQVDSDLQGAREIYRTYIDRLKDAVRIHSTRMVIYRALDEGDPEALALEMERVRRAENLDILNITDRSCNVFYRTTNPSARGDSQAGDELISRVVQDRVPIAEMTVYSAEELAKESATLVRKAVMQLTPTPMASPSGRTHETSGLVIKAAAPVFAPSGRFIGVLYGGVLVNRNYDIVDKIRKVVFRGERYEQRDVGTATIFQDDVRVSTNVTNEDGTRAITTRASDEVAEEVLRGGKTWRGRAFVVNDWYLSAYEPIRDIRGRTIGMLYVGTLEQPYRDSLKNILLVFLGITILGVALVSAVAITVAQRISRPIHQMAEAAKKVAAGEYSHLVPVTSKDEIGYLAECFNRMTGELACTTQELRDFASKLESKVEERTAQIRSMQSQLFQTEKLAAIGKLAAGVAHEINNPLTGILTNSSLMLSDLPPDDPSREELQVVVDETLRCRRIVKGLLDFARQTKPQKQALDLNQVVDDVLNLVKNQASFRNINLALNLDPQLPDVMADRDQMRQVALNIVLNAGEAMPAGGTLRVNSRANGHYVEVTIEDTGHGIPDEVKDTIFEPFITTKKTGTGLGLAIAYGIMERHHGAIHVNSRVGVGTAVTLQIPAGSGEADE